GPARGGVRPPSSRPGAAGCAGAVPAHHLAAWRHRAWRGGVRRGGQVGGPMSSARAAGSATPATTPSRVRPFLFPAVPLARIRVLRVIIYAFVVLDVLTLSRDVLTHAHNAGFYTPLALARL